MCFNNNSKSPVDTNVDYIPIHAGPLRWTASKFFGVLSLCSLLQGCASFDPFGVERNIPESPSAYIETAPVYVPTLKTVSMANWGRACPKVAQAPKQIAPIDAAQLALCHNPQTHESWAKIEAAAAQVGASYSTLLPTIDSTTYRDEGHAQQQVQSRPWLDQGNHYVTAGAKLNLSWVLYDGGRRLANIETARQHLFSEEASHNALLLDVFSRTMNQYFRVLAADATLLAKRQIEDAARDVLKVAQGRHNGGIAPLSDVLQARTALGSNSLDRIKAEGNLATQKAALAALLGFDPTTQFLVSSSKSAIPTLADVADISEKIQVAQIRHPSVLAAAARLKAQASEIDAAAAEGLPTLSASGSVVLNRATGQLSLPERTNTLENVWGLRLDIPLSAFVNRAYQIRNARANMLQASAEFEMTQLRVAQDAWTAYLALNTDVRSLQTANALADTARQSYAVAKGRYQNGIGSILELINAQVSLANAQQQQIQTQSSCIADRFQLEASLGILDVSDVH